MNDLKDLLELALSDGHAPVAKTPADPTGDLARGKSLLRRRARHRALGAAAVTAVAVAAGVAVPVALRGTPAPGAASGPVVTREHGSSPRIKLVAYTGTQPSGYVVKVIPAGWVIQGSTPYALVIAPANDTDRNPDVFVGKLVVLQESFDPSGAAALGWVPVSAAGHAVYYNPGQAGQGTASQGTASKGHASQSFPLTASVVIEQAPGRWLDVQAPVSLGWGQDALTQFGLGVTILATAQEGHG